MRPPDPYCNETPIPTGVCWQIWHRLAWVDGGARARLQVTRPIYRRAVVVRLRTGCPSKTRDWVRRLLDHPGVRRPVPAHSCTARPRSAGLERPVRMVVG